MIERVDRFKCFAGCLVGSAVGDALGAPAEFVSREVLDRQPITEMTGGGFFNWAPGQVTDDTAMMLCIAHSLVTKNGVDLMDIAHRLVEWADSNPPDIGNHTRRALQSIKNTGRWDGGCQIKNQENSAGNGSVIRTAPCGLIFREDTSARAKVAGLISKITHDHSLCVRGCQLVAHLIADLVRGRALTKTFDYWLSQEDFCQFDRRHVLREEIQSSGYVVHTIQAALWSIATTSSFQEAVLTAVNLGDDADSVGAVTGAIAGAWYGLDAIPIHWAISLRQSRQPDNLFSLLYWLADQIYQKGSNYHLITEVED